MICEKKLIEIIKKNIYDLEEYTEYDTSDEIMQNEWFLKIIDEQPKAYDVDKVVERLEHEKFTAFLALANPGDEKMDYIYLQIATVLDKAIEIVKKGGAE